MNRGIWHKPNQNREKNKKITAVCIIEIETLEDSHFRLSNVTQTYLDMY